MKDIESQIESALSREPDFQLPSNFADRMVSMIETARTREQRQEIFWIGIAALLFLAALVVVIAVTDFKIVTDSKISFISNNFGLVGFSIAFIAILNWMDRKLLQKVHRSI